MNPPARLRPASSSRAAATCPVVVSFRFRDRTDSLALAPATPAQMLGRRWRRWRLLLVMVEEQPFRPLTATLRRGLMMLLTFWSSRLLRRIGYMMDRVPIYNTHRMRYRETKQNNNSREKRRRLLLDRVDY